MMVLGLSHYYGIRDIVLSGRLLESDLRVGPVRGRRHDGDVGCAVNAAVESGDLDERRFFSFMKLNAEQARNSRSLAERRERDRKTGRMYKSIISAKKRSREF